jgi:hypothetical protein
MSPTRSEGGPDVTSDRAVVRGLCHGHGGSASTTHRRACIGMPARFLAQLAPEEPCYTLRTFRAHLLPADISPVTAPLATAAGDPGK